MTHISSRQVLQQHFDLFFERCLDNNIQIEDLNTVIELCSGKHFELILNKLENIYNGSIGKKNKFLNFIKEKLNEDKKIRENGILFSCLETAIKFAPTKELEFCADGISKKFLYPCLFNAKEQKEKHSLDLVLKCTKVLAETAKLILKDNPDFKLTQKADLLQSSYFHLQYESSSHQTRVNAISTVTSLVQLPPRNLVILI